MYKEKTTLRLYHPSFRFRRAGQTALSMTFLLGGIIVAVAVTLAFIVFSFLNASIGFERSTRAFVIASAGVDDALLRLARNKDFADAGYCVPEDTLPCDDGFATVAVTQDAPSLDHVTILSEATASRYKRKIEAIAVITASTSEISLVSRKLLPL